MNLHTCPLNNSALSTSQTALLKKGNLQTVADLLLNTPQDIARRCKTSPLDIKRTINTVLNSIPLHRLNILEGIAHDGEEKFSTGDAIFDNALQGGMRTGMVWEIVGESGAGKTQLALQLSLFVQAPKENGGLAGSACYLTTSSKLPTARLLQISQTHELLSPSFCSLEHVHTISIPTSDFLQLVLTTILPSFIQEQETTQRKKPVKLVIIDALAELFHSMGKTTTNTLVERKQNIAKISASLHEIASSYNIAIVVLNEVVDNFDQEHPGSRVPGEMTYKQQTRGFNDVDSSDGKKKAALGPAWTNQVNAKIMLSRTGRRKHLQDEDFPPKRRQLLEPFDNQNQPSRTSIDNQEPTLVRCLRVVFSSVSAPASLDFIVSECGISVLQDNTHTALISDQTSLLKHASDHYLKSPSAAQLVVANEAVAAAEVEDEYDKLWTEDTYNDFDWDALEQVLTQTV